MSKPSTAEIVAEWIDEGCAGSPSWIAEFIGAWSDEQLAAKFVEDEGRPPDVDDAALVAAFREYRGSVQREMDDEADADDARCDALAYGDFHRDAYGPDDADYGPDHRHFRG